MKGYINEMTSKIRLDEKEKLPADILNAQHAELQEDDELDEMSTSAGAGPYLTKYSFGKAKDSTVNAVGYKQVKKKDKSKDIKKESQFVQLSKQFHINEISYKDYKNDPELNSRQKVNKSIHAVNKKMFEIERIVSQNLKLKQEMKVNNSEFWKSTHDKMYKISERMIRVAQALKELNA